MYFQRKIYKEIQKNIENNKIIILTGPRQVGKTTLMKMVFEEIAKKFNPVFLDMDIVSNHDIADSLESFIGHLEFNGYKKDADRFYVFVDEFQRVPQMAAIFKNISDHYPNIKIFASGSSSLSIKKHIKESLAGRKFVFEIHPLDFEEFILFKQNEKAKEYYENIGFLKHENIILPKILDDLLEEYLIYGGYPEVALADTAENKKMLLNSIFDLYIEKDVMTFMGVENVQAYKKLIQLIAVDAGQLLNYNNLAQEVGLHNKTVRSYLGLLEDSYLIKIIRPFSGNKHNEIKKTPKIYFLDNGVRNYFLNNFNPLARRVDRGNIFENYVLNELIKNNKDGYSIYFWRTKQKEEVDFIVDISGRLTPIEVKIKSAGKPDHYRQVYNFLSAYKEEQGFLLSKNFNSTITKNNRRISAIPAVNFTDKILSSSQ